MASDIAQLTAQAMKLPRHLRLDLGYDLVLSLDSENLDAADRARVDELIKGYKELKARLVLPRSVPLISWKTRGTFRRIGPGMDLFEASVAEEIRRRVEEIRTGAVEGIDADEVMAEMRARFG